MFILVTGQLWRDPTSRTSKTTGKQFTTALLRAGTPTEAIFCNVVAFDETAQSELLRLREGELVSLQGTAKLGVYEKNGEHRASLEVVAAHVLALRQPPREKKPKPTKPKQSPSTPGGAPAWDDDFPDDFGGPQ